MSGDVTAKGRAIEPGLTRNGQSAAKGSSEKADPAASIKSKGTGATLDPIPTVLATPKASVAGSGAGGLAALSDRTGRSGVPEIPKIYLPRLDPDRTTQAQRIGASAASELAVERAINWLSATPR